MDATRLHRRTLLGLAGGATLGALGPERLATAAPIAGEEAWRLHGGAEIRVPLDLELPQGFYFGGIVYVVLQASVDEVMALACDPRAYTSILALTQEARVLARSGRDMQVYLRQGEGRGSVSYVLLMRRESQGVLRFWLDPSQPHDLDDGWGYLRVEHQPLRWWPEAAPRVKHMSLITWGVLLRIDSDFLRLRYAESIRVGAMAMPNLLSHRVYRMQSAR